MCKRIILSLLLITLHESVFCQTLHKDSIKTDYIEFGSGGGFSGDSKNYILTETGDLYIIATILANSNSLTYLRKVKKCTAKKIFSYVKKNKMIEIIYNEPGNIYYYINLSINTKTKNLVWGNTNTVAPENILILSTKLNNLL